MPNARNAEEWLGSLKLAAKPQGHPFPVSRLEPVEGATAIHLVAAHSLP